jgi:hypothetical protein
LVTSQKAIFFFALIWVFRVVFFMVIDLNSLRMGLGLLQAATVGREPRQLLSPIVKSSRFLLSLQRAHTHRYGPDSTSWRIPAAHFTFVLLLDGFFPKQGGIVREGFTWRCGSSTTGFDGCDP